MCIQEYYQKACYWQQYRHLAIVILTEIGLTGLTAGDQGQGLVVDASEAFLFFPVDNEDDSFSNTFPSSFSGRWL